MPQFKVEYGKFRRAGGDSTHLRRKLTEDAVKQLKFGLFEDIYDERYLESIMSLSFSYPEKKYDNFEYYFDKDLSLSYPKSKKKVLNEDFDFFEELLSVSFSYPKAKILDEDIFFLEGKYSSLSYSFPPKAATKPKSLDNFDFLMDEYLSLSFSYPKKMNTLDNEIDFYKLEDYMSLSYSYPGKKNNAKKNIQNMGLYKLDKYLSFSYSYPSRKKTRPVQDTALYELDKYLSLSYSYPNKKSEIMNDVKNSTTFASFPTTMNSDVVQLPVPANVSNTGEDTTVTSTAELAQPENFAFLGIGIAFSILAVVGFAWRKYRLYTKHKTGN